MRRLQALLHLSALLAAEVAAVVGLHRLGGAPAFATPPGRPSLQLPGAPAAPGDAWSMWLLATPPEDVVAIVLRLAALAVAWWLLGSTLLCIVARAGRAPGLLVAADRVALPSVRRLADRAVAVALTSTLSLAGGPALADQALPTPTPSPVAAPVEAAPDLLVPPGAGGPWGPWEAAELPWTEVPSGELDPIEVAPPAPSTTTPAPPRPGTDRLEAPLAPPGAAQVMPGSAPPVDDVPTPPGPPSPVTADGPIVTGPTGATAPGGVLPDGAPAAGAALSEGTTAPVPAHPDRTVAPSAGQQRRIRAGEHLWAIAAATLAAGRGVPAAQLHEADIHRYWRELMAANAPRLRSGDVDLVYPGEVLVLPPLSG